MSTATGPTPRLTSTPSGWLRCAGRPCVGASTLRHTGYALTHSCVMAALEPVDERPELLRRRLGSELGPLGSLEDGVARDIWYSTVLHFAAPIADPEGLVSWVADRRRIVETTVAIDSVSLVRFRYAEAGARRWMQPDEWQRSALRPVDATSGAWTSGGRRAACRRSGSRGSTAATNRRRTPRGSWSRRRHTPLPRGRGPACRSVSRP